MVVLRFVQRVDSAEVVADGARMVCNNVYHDPHVFIVSGLYEILQVIRGAEVGVGFLPVCGPVSMVAAVDVVDNRRDPDGVETHALNVVQIVDHALVVTSAVT